MTDKQLIANDLLPVYQTDTGEKIVNGRELHEFLKVGRDFTNWIKERIQKYGFVENEDFSPILAKTSEQGGRPRTEYILKLDMAKELSMVENNEQGRKARKYFIEVEKRYTAQPEPKVPLHDPNQTLEFDRINRMLQMLRMGTKDGLFNQTTEKAMRAQIAEMITGQQLVLPQKEKPRGRSIKDIANSLGITFQKAVWIVKRHDLKKTEYGSFYQYEFRGQPKEIFLYNKAGEEAIKKLLNEEGIKTNGTNNT